MNTDIFGKEERKQMLTRIERMELMNGELTKAITGINETLKSLNEKMDGDVKSMDWSKITGEPMPEPSRVRFDEKWAECRKECDSRFEMEMGVLRGIRSGIAETNSLLASMMGALHNIDAKLTDAVLAPKPPIYPYPPNINEPPYKFMNCNKGTDPVEEANPYIPKSTYIDDSITPVDDEKEE